MQRLAGKSIIAAICVAAVGLAPSAAADVSSSPRAVGLVDSHRGKLPLVAGASMHRFGPSEPCVTAIEDGFGQPGDRRFRVVRRRLRPGVVLRTGERPDIVEIEAWRHLDDNGQLSGLQEPKVKLHPKRRNREIVAWIARFRTKVKTSRYIYVRARWRDSECDGFDSYSWTFQLDRAR